MRTLFSIQEQWLTAECARNPAGAPAFIRRLPVSKSSPKKSRARSTAKTPCPWLDVSRTGSNLNVEDFLTFRITRLSNALRANLTKKYLAEFDLSLPEWRLLALVARFAPMRFSEVTSRSSMDKGQVSRTLRAMEKRGMTKMKVIRNRGARSVEVLAAPVMVSITAKGRALYRAVLPVARRRQAEMLLTLSATDRVELYSTLDKLFVTIGQVPTSNDETE
jgi:DNA-binding MarR family transcriptional regulator